MVLQQQYIDNGLIAVSEFRSARHVAALPLRVFRSNQLTLTEIMAVRYNARWS